MRDEAEVRRFVAARIASGAAPGFQFAAADGRGGRIDVVAGVADAAPGAPVDQQTAFLSCSCSKIVTAVLALQCVDDGVLDLDGSLGDYIPHPYGPGVTIGRLLDHTSGVPSPSPLDWTHTEEEHAAFDERAALDAVLVRHRRLKARPGAWYLYSNLGYWLLGFALEQVRRRSFAELVASRIAGRLGLADGALGCVFPETNAARGHFPRGAPEATLARLLTRRALWDTPTERWLRCRPLTLNGAAFGGVFATASGYLALLADLLSPKPALLTPVRRDQLLAPRFNMAGRPLGGTLGFQVGVLGGETYCCKAGGGPGFSGEIRIYPAVGLARVWLSNRFAFSETAIRTLSDRLDSSMLGP